MRIALLASLAILMLCAACGQKGPLVLPQKSVATPVLIRAPGSDAPPAAPQPATQPETTPTDAKPADVRPPADRKDDESTPPPR